MIEAGVYNTWSLICHRSSCQAIQNANSRNYRPVESWAKAVELGLKSCGICHPDELPPIGSVMRVHPAAAGPLPVMHIGLKSTPDKPSLDEQIAANDRRIAELQQQIDDAKRTQQVQLPPAEVIEWRRRIAQALSRLDHTTDRPAKEGLAARISRLSRAGVISRQVANMMLTITEMRNAIEYDSKELSSNENLAAWANWNAIQEWAAHDGLRI
jgi:hypothetical protein